MGGDHLSFHLDDDFVNSYRERPVRWGYPVGNGWSLGEINWIDKYSRIKADGTKEQWWEGCRRVVEGVYSILFDHCRANRTRWLEDKATAASQDMYERLFTFRWTPPGRGLWMMGTPFVMENGSAALQNCAFVSTQDLPRDPTFPFIRLMEMSLLGVGVGFDTLGANRVTITEPRAYPGVFRIPDSREGWTRSTELLLKSYLTPTAPGVAFDYGAIRPAGSPIKGFGGVAAGPGPLRELHQSLRAQLDGRHGHALTSTDIVDIMNKIGRCVVSGNIRRSAELALGSADDKDFIGLKDWSLNPERMAKDTGWGNLSNNSVVAEVGGNYDDLVPRMALNGEPGLVYMDLIRAYGRLIDQPDWRDHRSMGVNPCGEQSLEPNECCTLVETYPINCTDYEDYRQTLKVAYLYAKAVTLLPTCWPESNEVMARNRRIGCSNSGHVQFAEKYGWTELRSWLSHGYDEILARDREYSEWLGVRESLKKTSVKPSGTVSLLAGVTPGVHWPVADTYIRRMRFAVTNPLVEILERSRFHVEPDRMDPDHQAVVAFPTLGPETRSEDEVSVWEKASLASLLQRHWADNQVSATLTFNPDTETKEIGPLLHAMDGQLKVVTFLPKFATGAYAQMPYEPIGRGEWSEQSAAIGPPPWHLYAEGVEATGEQYCTTDRCELPVGE